MLASLSRRLLTIVATLSLVCTLVATACPTCEPVAHAPAPRSGDTCGNGAMVNDWQAGPEGCDCCESDGCQDGDTLPDGLLQRPAPVTPVTAVLPAPLVPPRDIAPAALPGNNVDPPGRTRLHIQYASFRC